MNIKSLREILTDSKKFLRKFKKVKKFIENISWEFANRIVTIITTVAISIIVARYLGPENFGLLSYARSFVQMFAAISALSLGSILVRELSRNPEKKNMLLGTSYFLRSGGALISNILIIIIAFVITDEETGRLLILVIAGSELFKGFEVI